MNQQVFTVTVDYELKSIIDCFIVTSEGRARTFQQEDGYISTELLDRINVRIKQGRFCLNGRAESGFDT